MDYFYFYNGPAYSAQISEREKVKVVVIVDWTRFGALMWFWFARLTE